MSDRFGTTRAKEVRASTRHASLKPALNLPSFSPVPRFSLRRVNLALRVSVALDKIATEQKSDAPHSYTAFRPGPHSTDQLRYKFLFFVQGGAQNGQKHVDVDGEVAWQYGWGNLQAVQSAPVPNLEDSDKKLHGYTLFDNVNDVQFVLDDLSLGAVH